MDNKEYTVKLKGIGTSHKKMHVVSRAVSGMKLLDAINFLSVQNTDASRHFVQLLTNALKNYPSSAKSEDLKIKEIVTSVGSNRGKSYHAKSRGRGFAIRNRGKSNITLTITSLI